MLAVGDNAFDSSSLRVAPVRSIGNNAPMKSSMFAALRSLRFASVFAFGLLAGCQSLMHKPEPESVPEAAPPAPVFVEPVATHRFELQPDQDVIGELQITKVEGEDTGGQAAGGTRRNRERPTA